MITFNENELKFNNDGVMTPLPYFSNAVLSNKQDKLTTTTVTLAVAGWSSNEQTVSVSGVTASNTIWISPASSSFADYTSSVIRCSAQASGTLTFTCSTVPTSAITVNVVIAD